MKLVNVGQMECEMGGEKDEDGEKRIVGAALTRASKHAPRRCRKEQVELAEDAHGIECVGEAVQKLRGLELLLLELRLDTGDATLETNQLRLGLGDLRGRNSIHGKPCGGWREK